jgi:multimeric flavodoxin WrbA
MKVISILGSPKGEGNTAAILDEIERPLKENGAEVVRYCLGKCRINYCVGCKSCFGDGGLCVQNDDVQTIINDLFESNLVIVASPSYWGDVTGQMKVLIDRCTPYCNVKHTDRITASKIKGVAVAVRAGRNKAENENLVHTIEHFLGHLNIPLISNFTAEGIDTAEDLTNRPELLKNAYDFGRSILDNLTKQT